MGILNLHPSISKISPRSGALHTKPLHPIIHRVMATLKPLLDLWRELLQLLGELEHLMMIKCVILYNLPDLQNGSTVALQNPQTKLWDIYGTIINIGPIHRYYIKTQSGHDLLRKYLFTITHLFLYVHQAWQYTQPQYLNQHQVQLNSTVKTT